MTTTNVLKYGYNEFEGARIYLIGFNTFGEIEVTNTTFKKNEGVVGAYRWVYDHVTERTTGDGLSRVFEYYVDNSLYEKLSLNNKKILLEYILQANRLAPKQVFSLHPTEVQESLIQRIDDNMVNIFGKKKILSFIRELELAAVQTYHSEKSWLKKFIIYISQCKDSARTDRYMRIKKKFK